MKSHKNIIDKKTSQKYLKQNQRSTFGKVMLKTTLYYGTFACGQKVCKA